MDTKNIYREKLKNLDIFYNKLSEDEVKTYQEVTEKDNNYAKTLIILGLHFASVRDFEMSRDTLGKINKHNGKYLYYLSNFIIDNTFIEEGKYDLAMVRFKIFRQFNYYYGDCYERVLDLFDDNDNDNDKFIHLLIDSIRAVSRILNCLRLNDEYEKYICHYTRSSTAFSLLGDNNSPSSLRLNTIKNVNDPMEGKILCDYLSVPNSDIVRAGSFITCFTFNRDSLNQFRLYGKDKGQEASGVSLVFDKDFFSEDLEFFNSIAYKLDELPIKPNGYNKIDKLPVYRCVYIDVEYDYIKLARRDEIEFYRESKVKDFENYLMDIKNKTLEVKKNLNEIKEISKEIKNLQNENIDKYIYDIFNYILLPLKILVKHAAFENEQECRIFFITDLFDERIVSDVNNKSMYLEYEPSVREHIKEIYLSIGASQYEDFFIRNLRDSYKVHHSKNPFRNK